MPSTFVLEVLSRLPAISHRQDIAAQWFDQGLDRIKHVHFIVYDHDLERHGAILPHGRKMYDYQAGDFGFARYLVGNHGL